jgi:phospholipid/cholesterol/gamma-HCH transport system permease protein
MTEEEIRRSLPPPPLTERAYTGFTNGLETLGGIGQLSLTAIVRMVQRPFELGALAEQIVHIGARSMSIVMLTALFSSMVMTVQFALQLARFGAKEWVGNVVAVSLARELGPVLTALMVGGRVGAGIAAELGSMAVTEQIDAIRVLGADPVKKLVVPRMLAAVIVLPLMTAMAVVLGVFGGAVIASLDGQVSIRQFIDSALRSTTMEDFLSGLSKTLFFAFNISVVACYRGMNARGGTAGVGVATTQTVVTTSIVTLISDFFLTKLMLSVGGG